MDYGADLVNSESHDNWTCGRYSDGARVQIDFSLAQLHVDVLDAWNDFALPTGIDQAYAKLLQMACQHDVSMTQCFGMFQSNWGSGCCAAHTKGKFQDWSEPTCTTKQKFHSRPHPSSLGANSWRATFHDNSPNELATF